MIIYGNRASILCPSPPYSLSHPSILYEHTYTRIQLEIHRERERERERKRERGSIYEYIIRIHDTKSVVIKVRPGALCRRVLLLHCLLLLPLYVYIYYTDNYYYYNHPPRRDNNNYCYYSSKRVFARRRQFPSSPLRYRLYYTTVVPSIYIYTRVRPRLF